MDVVVRPPTHNFCPPGSSELLQPFLTPEIKLTEGDVFEVGCSKPALSDVAGDFPVGSGRNSPQNKGKFPLLPYQHGGQIRSQDFFIYVFLHLHQRPG